MAKEGGEMMLEVEDAKVPGGKRAQRWQFHSRADCVRCHQVEFHKRHGNLDAFTATQLSSLQVSGRRELDRLIDLGLIEESAGAMKTTGLVNPHNKDASLDSRGRSYMHANCSHCHKPGATGAVMMYWPVNYSEERTGAFDVPPVRGTFGITDARILAPGAADHSTVLYRMLTTGTGRMPAVGSREVDEAGAILLRDWIESMPNAKSREASDASSALAEALEAVGMQQD
ncbi:MAG: c-type cytochrome, partial [Verrucomicrobiales bacterium]